MGAKLSGPGGQGGKTIEQNADINVTPFVDIMLVLLIIFMVAAPMATVSIRLDLPPATPPTTDEPKEPVYITIQEGGALFLSDRETSIATLPVDVCTALAVATDCREERVFVRAQPDVTYDQFMEVMNTLQENGFFKVGLLNEDIE
ncbi:MAG: biopolymer transporter ExbD [Alphaproteobacteria bacterium]|jgi:biopolymer transport protein ExbD|nr:biopolymer transporter ExbD [Alphaproteobacteria bacterium]MBU2042173.1 biopolymer transporter ExbD [Alphaproteobacteria bacterium]MBU2124483.1 biopolymer transporter ExbD [Alphaproteobacteria bacterium]MBU2208725.1 biopolymer transporter ExbD [Alphaproteobacteria bacterium]MBU2292404.1 biopolymer transporter ExbD [Alphaproteobacteria bacterium]